MPRLTMSRVRMDRGQRLPDKKLVLSKKGGTSLVYNHPDDPDRVLVYTIEAAKAYYWQTVDFTFKRQQVGAAELSGYPHNYLWYNNPKYTVERYPLHECEVPRVSFDFDAYPVLKKERNRARKIVNDLYAKHMGKDDREFLIWEDLVECEVEALRIGADYALGFNGNMYPQNPRDAFCIWSGKLFWLDPYHEVRLLDMIRATVRPRSRSW